MSCSLIWNVFICLLIMPNSLCLFLCIRNIQLHLPVLKAWPYVECVLCGLVGQSPSSPELGAPGVSPVWAACALLLLLGHNCYGCTSMCGWPPGQLAESPGSNCCRCLVDGADPHPDWLRCLAATAMGVMMCRAGPLEGKLLWRSSDAS